MDAVRRVSGNPLEGQRPGGSTVSFGDSGWNTEDSQNVDGRESAVEDTEHTVEDGGLNAREKSPCCGSQGRTVDSPPAGTVASLHTELLEVLECQLCYLLLYQPLTTPCGHTFCKPCFARSLDHSNKCPLCRAEVPSFAFFQDHPSNATILKILTAETGDLLDRATDNAPCPSTAIEQEEREARLSTPIFVCTLAFPGMPTILHIFEPRYRLMVRRCLESGNPRFGMVLPSRNTDGPVPGVHQYGTMLEIKSVQMLADGRSMLETVGSYRFKLLEKGSLDGYSVGRIERMSFAPLPAEPSTAELISTCHSFIETLRSGSAPWLITRLNHTYGPMPGAHEVEKLGYWMALVMPIDEHEKAKLLPITSRRLRLCLVVHWIEQLRQSWWFNSGCTIS
ncbi:LON-domain-containing protein [Violaceomyces palustris]|uniref:LON-domain-containing protein n=1 Tax=Violaceomyces palustris TaxID=1673888 RepID=A0ACD0NLL9_9BASI|nr:LON-domain-containing protein [Violaceomyces palustris]